MNKFKAKLYNEYEANCNSIFGVSGERVREVLSERGNDLFELYEEAWSYGGARFMRLTMAYTILTLEVIYHQEREGVSLSDEQRHSRYASFKIGLDEESINEWQNMRAEQLSLAD